MIDILSYKKNNLIVGRGSTAIYLALKNAEIQNKEIIIPANICYAAVFPIILSGNTPVFCDVNPIDGNIDFENVLSVFTENTSAVIVPHMYGNPVKSIIDISNFAKKNDLILIEDCASCMGGFADYGNVGTIGDYVIYSTGHSKTVDIGNGGILSSDFDLSLAKNIYKSLPLYNDKVHSDLDVFSKFYRLIRNNPNTAWSNIIYSGLHTLAKDLFLYRADTELEKDIYSSISKLDSIIKERRKCADLYDTLLIENQYFKKYKFSSGAVPWRYNILIEKDTHDKLIKYLLENDAFVSDWYPCVTNIFFNDQKFINAKIHENTILNFPIPYSEEGIRHICSLINSFL